MRYLKHYNPPVELITTGKEKKIYKLRFSLDVIDEIQDKTEMPLPKIMSKVTSERSKKAAISVLFKYLTGDNIEPEDDKLDYYSILLMQTYIDQLTSKPYEGEKKPEPSDIFEFINVERFFYIATVILNRPTNEAWQMTLGEIATLKKEHELCVGSIKEDKEVDIMDVE